MTSVLIGPRRPEHLQDLLAGAEVQLSEEVLDRIDDIVAPGTNLNQADIIAGPAGQAPAPPLTWSTSSR